MNEPIINRPTRMGQPPQRRLMLDANNHLEDVSHQAPTALVPNTPLADPMAMLAPGPLVIQDPPTGSIGPNHTPGRQTFEGGAPGDPQTAAQLAELLKQNGDLVRALGEDRKKHELAMKQMRFDVQTQLAARDGAPTVQLPPNVDPNAPVSNDALLQVLTKNNLAMEAHNIRRGWDVTPTEEAVALQRNPVLAGLEEPRRTVMIQQAVSLLREEAGPAPTSTESLAPPVDPNRRPAREVVAAPEILRSAPTGGMHDGQGESELQKAQRQYAEADRLPDKTQRLETKKALYDRILALQGLNSAAVLSQSFKMG